ncbi:MAG: class I SAM-dependent methyltransferase [Aquabacterium sp.]|nr:class I SAM-dependent methyltransferase [Aquabacterium sp.]
MSNYYDGLNLKLLAAIPSGATRVLELGCSNGRLGQRFKELHPGVQWWGVDLAKEAVKAASAHLDRVFELNLDSADLAVLEGGFDVIVIGDLLEHLRSPVKTLEALYDLATPDGQIVCCLPNMAHLSVIERLVAGDISYDHMGLLDETHTRFFSPSSAFKTFLDGGWLPHLQDQYRVDVPQTPFASHIIQAAQALGLPEDTARRNLGLYQMILVCKKWSMDALQRPGPSVPISIIVPVNRPWQYDLNIARSPGLREINAEIISLQGADSAAAAYAEGVKHASHAWRVLVHQDVYFPTGSGFALARQLALLEQAGLTGAPVGFAGLEAALSPVASVRYSGMVIDRTSLFDHPGSECALSLDEFAVALHRDSPVSIDPSLGWHLWGTDLCLQAEALAKRPVARVLQVPLFHNSTTAYALPDAYYESADRLLTKYPQLDRIPTLCGEITRTATDATAVA